MPGRTATMDGFRRRPVAMTDDTRVRARGRADVRRTDLPRAGTAGRVRRATTSAGAEQWPRCHGERPRTPAMWPCAGPPSPDEAAIGPHRRRAHASGAPAAPLRGTTTPRSRNLAPGGASPRDRATGPGLLQGRRGRSGPVRSGRRYRIGASPAPNAVKIRVVRLFRPIATSGKSPTGSWQSRKSGWFGDSGSGHCGPGTNS